MSFNDKKDFLAELEYDCDKKVVFLDGYEDALIGYCDSDDGNIRTVYCYEDCIDILMTRDGMTMEEAEEWMSYNTIRSLPYAASMGTIPLMIHRFD